MYDQSLHVSIIFIQKVGSWAMYPQKKLYNVALYYPNYSKLSLSIYCTQQQMVIVIVTL